MTHIQLVTSLSCLVFLIDHSWSDRSRQFNIFFSVDQTYKMDHIIVLFGFCHKSHLVRLIKIARFHFRHRLYHMIDHIIVLFGFCHKSHLVRLIKITWFHFRHRLYLYDRSCSCFIWVSSQTNQSGCCHIWFSLQTSPSQIRPNNLFSILE